jgi:hypothetical protein
MASIDSLGLADEAAGVDHAGVGVLGGARDGETGVVRQPEHDLGVDAVFRTAE